MTARKHLGLFDLVLMNLVAVTSLRWIATASSNGPPSLGLWILAAICFLIPQGLAVAELADRSPESGGLYRWTKEAAGDAHAFICGWCYWINNIIFFPTLLIFIFGNAAFIANQLAPEWTLPKNPMAVVTVSLITLWAVAYFNFRGLHVAKSIQNAGALSNFIPPLVIITLGTLYWYYKGSANPIQLGDWIPQLNSFRQFSFFAQICFALAGIELMSFALADVKNPRPTVGLSILISAFGILAVYLIGTFGVLLAVPKEKLTSVNGILYPIETVSRYFHVPWLAPLTALFIGIGGIGAVMAWFSGVSRLPYLVGIDRYLPEKFGTLHPKYGTPHHAILWQTILATGVAIFAAVGTQSKIEIVYQILVDMCLVLYFIPYIYLFYAVHRLPKTSRNRIIPGGLVGRYLTILTGTTTTVIAIGTTLMPLGIEMEWFAFFKMFFGSVFVITAGLYVFRKGRLLKIAAV